jgi:hypothetical protein
MRKYALSAALAGAVIAAAMALPNRADAMTFSTPSGVLDAGATIDVTRPEQVRWCGSRGCWARYRYYDYYRPWPYYNPVWNATGAGTGRAAFKLRSCVVDEASGSCLWRSPQSAAIIGSRAIEL